MNSILMAITIHAKNCPDQIALMGEYIEVSYADLSEKIDLLADWLGEQNLARIGLLGENSVEWIIADLAAWKAGVTLVPLPGFFSSNQLHYVIANAQLSGVLVCGNGILVPDAISREATPIAGIFLDTIKACAQAEPIQDICKITFTSGTTGTPKGVCLSTEAIENVALDLAERM